MVRYSSGLKAVIRTSWTNRNPGRHFYGCPTLSPACVNFLRWFDPPMCQRSVQIIPRLLRACNELEEILAMVKEKRLRCSWLVLGYGIVDECGFELIDGINSFGFLQVLFSLRARTTAVPFLRNLEAYITMEELKGFQKDDLIKAMEMRKVLLVFFKRPSSLIVDTRESEEESVMSTQEYIRKVIDDVGEDDDFTRVSWLSVLDYVNVDGGIMTVTLKDLSGTISDTIHYKVLTEERFAKAITIGAALIIHNAFFFSPKQSTHHYLNITKKNMVKVFHKDGGSA
nr:hypothetical protein [Tanacetum cinerariifolium]